MHRTYRIYKPCHIDKTCHIHKIMFFYTTHYVSRNYIFPKMYSKLNFSKIYSINKFSCIF